MAIDAIDRADLISRREFSDKERDAAADSGAALPDGSFPIKTKKDLANAIHAYGRAKDKAKAKAHIKARARALGATDMLPDDWKADGDGDVAKGVTMKEGTEVVFRDSSTSPAASWVGKSVGTVIARREIVGLKTAALDVAFKTDDYDGTVEGIPENQLVTFHDFERDEIRAATGGMDPDMLIDLMEKAGARHGMKDRVHIQKAHDHLAAVADGAHCGAGTSEKAAFTKMQKRGSKFSAADAIKIGQAHDLCKDLGAKCDSTVQKDEE